MVYLVLTLTFIRKYLLRSYKLLYLKGTSHRFAPAGQAVVIAEGKLVLGSVEFKILGICQVPLVVVAAFIVIVGGALQPVVVVLKAELVAVAIAPAFI
jgi:hypothetical protein